MKVLVTGTEGYIGAVVPQALMERGHEVIGVDAGFHRSGLALRQQRPGDPEDTREGHPAARRATISRASMRSCTWRSCRTTPSASSTRRSPMTSTTSARCISRSWRSSRASSGSSTRRRAASTGSPRTTWSTSSRPRTRRRRTPSARHSSNETSALLADDELLAHVPAQRDRLRRLAPDSLRHRDQQPVRPRVDDRRDPHGERRDAVAPVRAHQGHRDGDRLHARRAPRGRPRRDLQRRELPGQLSGPRYRRDRESGVPRLLGHTCARAEGPTHEATASRSTRSTISCPASRARGMPSSEYGSSIRSSSGSTSAPTTSAGGATHG